MSNDKEKEKRQAAIKKLNDALSYSKKKLQELEKDDID